MSALRVYFYKGPTGFPGRLLRSWTGSPYSHCALVIIDRSGTDVIAEAIRGTKVSCHVILPEIDLRESQWDHIDIPVSTVTRDDVLTWCQCEIGVPYDNRGWMWSQLLHIPLAHTRKWTSAEFCAAALQRLGMLRDRDAEAFSPGSLYRALKPGPRT